MEKNSIGINRLLILFKVSTIKSKSISYNLKDQPHSVLQSENLSRILLRLLPLRVLCQPKILLSSRGIQVFKRFQVSKTKFLLFPNQKRFILITHPLSSKITISLKKLLFLGNMTKMRWGLLQVIMVIKLI